MTPERWRDVYIPDCPDYALYYEVSNYGSVRSKERQVERYSEYHGGYITQNRKSKLLSMRPLTKGHRYHVVCLKLPDGSERRIARHILVALAFKRKGYAPGLVVRHKDDDRDNNFYKNLEWGTQLDNIQDRQERNRQTKGEAHPFSKLTEAQARKIKALCRKGVSRKDIAERFNISKSVVCRIGTGEAWTHLD